MASGAIHITGIAELERAFGRADKAVRQDMKDALAEAAAPVRSDAQALAGAIRNMGQGDPWTRMRIGVSRAVAYVAPVERGVRGRRPTMRPNLADKMMDEAMIPALNKNRAVVEQRVSELLDEVANVWDSR